MAENMLGTLLAITLVVLEGFAIYFSWRAISSARTPQGAVGWVVFLIAAPYVAVPLYLFLGHHKFAGYVLGRRESEQVIEGVRGYAKEFAPANPLPSEYKVLETIAELPAVRGNDIELLIDGKATFDAIFAAIDAAESYVLVQSYIVNDDGVGRELSERMIAAAKRGVTVRFMTDAVGSMKLPPSYYGTLREAGVDFVNPKTSRGPKNRFQLNFRNHRKTVVVDGKTAFTGGLNFGDEYLGLNPKFGDWRDTHARLTGPIVSQLQLVFAEDWHWGTSEILIDDLEWSAGTTKPDMTALVMATGPGDDLETGALYFISCIAAAKERVWIATPYFVPDTDVLSALKLAALRGIDVRILVPDVIDHKVPWLAAFAYFDEVRDVGVSIWRYTEGFMHQKTVLVDDAIAAVGTTNMDNRSFRLNFEAMAIYFDARAAKDLEEMLEADFARSFQLSKRLSEQNRGIRIGAPIARLFSPLL